MLNRTYTVTATAQFPAAREQPSVYTVNAASKAQAIKFAKEQAAREGAYMGKGEGRTFWRATVAN